MSIGDSAEPLLSQDGSGSPLAFYRPCPALLSAALDDAPRVFVRAEPRFGTVNQYPHPQAGFCGVCVDDRLRADVRELHRGAQRKRNSQAPALPGQAPLPELGVGVGTADNLVGRGPGRLLLCHGIPPVDRAARDVLAPVPPPTVTQAADTPLCYSWSTSICGPPCSRARRSPKVS